MDSLVLNPLDCTFVPHRELFFQLQWVGLVVLVVRAFMKCSHMSSEQFSLIMASHYPAIHPRMWGRTYEEIFFNPPICDPIHSDQLKWAHVISLEALAYFDPIAALCCAHLSLRLNKKLPFLSISSRGMDHKETIRSSSLWPHMMSAHPPH